MNSDDHRDDRPGSGDPDPVPETGPLDLVAVRSLYDEATAEVLRIILEDEGIRCHVENSYQAGLAGVLPVRLLVPASDAEKAKRVLERVSHGGEFPDGDDDSISSS